MRPLKFRVWFQGQMHQVRGLFFNGDGTMIGLARHTTPDTVEYMSEAERLPLMQFTGLTDKHGNEIYEGDIVKGRMAHVDEIEEVGYEETGELSPFHVTTGYSGETWVNDLIDGFEIIGNIYEHPELRPKRGKP